MTENVFRLKNGASMLTARNEALHSVSFSVVFPFCAHKTAGTYHFIEHLFFERAGELRAEEINRKMSECGSEILAYTAKNHMCFSFHCRREVFGEMLGLLCSMLSEKGHGQEEFDKVLPVVENEIFEYGFYDYAREDILRELWYDANYRESVLGTPKTLEALNLSVLRSARDGLFTDAVHIYLVGGFDERDEATVKRAFESFTLSAFQTAEPVEAPPKYRGEMHKKGRGKDLQMMFTYHVREVGEEEIFCAPFLKNAIFYGMDALFNEFMTQSGFPFYSVDADYAVQGKELLFYWLVHVKRREVKNFKRVAEDFERAVLKAPLMGVVRPFMGENLVFLYDNPERLVNHYTDAFEDTFRNVTLQESRSFAAELSDNRLYDVWKTLLGGERKIFLIGK